jgi:competence protein ComEA
MKSWWWVLGFGVLGGLLGAGIILLVSSQPRGSAVQLQPAPTAAPIMVHVSGSVLKPGVYALPHASRVQDAIQAAGGLLPAADDQIMNLAAPLKDGERIKVPSRRPTDAALISSGATLTPGSRLININWATQAELESLPGIGPEMAKRILDYRDQNGPFESIEAIQQVSGIGPATYARLQDQITVDESP